MTERTNRTMVLIAAAATLAVLPRYADAQLARPEDVVEIKSALPKTGFNPGETFQVALLLEIIEGYHVNANDVKDPTLIPTEVLLPEDSPVTFPFIRYPEDQGRGGVRVPGYDNDEYHDQVMFRLVGRLPEDAEVGEIKVSLKIRYQTCTDTVCLYPYDKPVELVIPIVAPGTPVEEINKEIFSPGGVR